MTIRAKWKLSIAIWFLVGIPLGVGVVEVSEYFLIPLLLLFFGVGLYSLLLKCPNCGTRFYHPGFYWIPKNCRNCDANLD
jgi:hypothetical protein